MASSSEFHTHHATPQRLVRELRFLLGDGAQFKVEMRHNVYNIESDQDLDLEKLQQRCKQRRQVPLRFP
ncbi:hypothetical protein BGZ61DRAFT_459050 [Ilyonectria robusta]|uniref:uncharacterized protein n=1 Tax=Ilyonectria robusta TaxID=1079257 RepID=UPI001E8E23A1|nr:uncharacterized protein BGZ61DRAFT_459050 [Ilyonectria robusta]KAH8672211.1 hypothetical protein BGZ61DRAFT_459050 [Ilyonectria robusta]